MESSVNEQSLKNNRVSNLFVAFLFTQFKCELKVKIKFAFLNIWFHNNFLKRLFKMFMLK